MICYYCSKEIKEPDLCGLHEKCFQTWFKLEKAEQFYDLDPKTAEKSAAASPEFKKKDTFFHGQYLKYSAKLGTTDYILKIQEKEYPDLPASEYLCNQIAKVLNIKVPEFFLIEFLEKKTFVTRNFMQDHVGALHHIYKFLPPGEENHNFQKISEIILQQTQRLADVATFAEICLFDALIGNNDRHGRNIGIIETTKGKMLAPMYDNPSYLAIVEAGLLGANFNVSCSVWTEASKEPKIKDYIVELNNQGHSRVVENFKSKVLSKNSEITSLISNSFIEQGRKKAFLKFIEKRIEELEGE